MPIQQMLLGAGGEVAKKTYQDDIFSMYVYAGNSTARSINNGIDLSGEGGLVWIKRRDGSDGHALFDTTRGATKGISSDTTSTESTDTDSLTSFNNNGFSLGTGYTNFATNLNNTTYASWTFRKTPGFFDIVTYTSDGSQKTISHSLGSMPGLIMIKNRSRSAKWVVASGAMTDGWSAYLELNSDDSYGTDYPLGTHTPTATNFTITTSSGLGDAADSFNRSGDDYVAYLFAGGESTQNEAVSVDFDGSGDYLSVADSDDFCFESGAFTIEAWIKPTTITNKAFIAKWVGGQREWFFGTNNDELKFAYSTDGSGYTILDSGYDMKIGQWQHIAVTRDSSNKIRIFVDGIHRGATHSVSATFHNSTQALVIAHNDDSDSWQPNAKISNVRIVKGTAVYTSSFRPPTEPLTNITNTKLLCCNNSSTTGSTVTPTTITANGNPTASTDSPFNDPAGFVFGAGGDQDLIKTGSYIGNGSSDGPEIFLGWEPQWIMVKNADSSSRDWIIWDSMRGITTGGNDARLKPNQNEAEGANNAVDLTPTGFKIVNTAANWNENNKQILYLAIRRPDGYVGKPPELGTGVFAMDTGNSSSTIPTFDSGFPVDFAFERTYASTQSWYTGARLISGKYLTLNGTGAEGNASDHTFDSNTGWQKSGYNTTHQSWMWKRHAGFDVVTYEGTGTTHQIAHSLNKTVEMFWLKSRDSSANWMVWHKGLNGGTNPEQYFIRLNLNNAESQGSSFGDTAPTSTHFTVGASSNAINTDGDDCIALLFASVDGISKVGSYTGSGSTQTITTGFQPRFVIIKNASNNSTGWYVLDTTRGWGSGNDKYLFLNTNAAQGDHNFGAPTATGFTVENNFTGYNFNGSNYIYYAHA